MPQTLPPTPPTQTAAVQLPKEEALLFGTGGMYILQGSALIIALAAVWALLQRHFGGKLKDAFDLHLGVHNVMDRDIRDLRAGMTDQAKRIDDALKTDTDHEKRLSKVETSIEKLEESNDRIEKKVDDGFERMERSFEKKFDQFAESIREIRDVKKKD